MTHWIHVLTALVQYTGLLVLFGALATRNTNDRRIPPVFLATVQSRFNRILIGALFALTFSAPAVLAIRATMMTGSTGMQAYSALPTLLLDTHYGWVWLVRCCLLLCSWMLVLALIKTQKQWPVQLLLLLAIFIAWTISAVGHASGWDDFSWQQLTDCLHIISASLWGGSMLSSLFVIWPLLGNNKCQDFINQTAFRLSRLSSKVFLIVIATGVANLYLQLASPNDLVDTKYGQILLIKIFLVSMMLYFAFINRYLYLVKLQTETVITDKRTKMARLMSFFAPELPNQLKKTASQHFFRVLVLETLCLVAVLVCTSILRHGPPPPHMMM